MEKYILVTWPEIQDFMELPNYQKEVFLGHSIEDSTKYAGVINDCWFVPEYMYNKVYKND